MEEPRTYSAATWGLVAGILVGTVISVLLFAFTGNAIWFVATGIVGALGLAIGAGIDQDRAQREE